MSALKLFNNTIAKNWSLFGTSSSPRTANRRKLTDFLGDLKKLALKAYPKESQDIRDHLVLRELLDKIKHIQARLDHRKQIIDKDMQIEAILGPELHLEAVTRIEEDEQRPKIAVVRRAETKDLLEAVTKLVH